MRHFSMNLLLILMITLIILTSCDREQKALKQKGVDLIEIARSERQWTGVAVSKEGRIFVNYPRWSNSVSFSVGEIKKTGKIAPFPDENWNTWDPSLTPKDHFICVQSVYIDKDGFLWILDPANPQFEGVIKNGPKLIKVDLSTNKVVQKIYFDESVAPPDSYLNDVRIDTKKRYAYLTDSEKGALIVVNLATEKSRRLLSQHSSTKSENITLIIEGTEWRLPDGSIPQVHSDGIALDPKAQYLYYQALTGRSLYRIATKWLRNETLSEQQLGGKVEFLSQTGAADGIMFDPYGNLYLSALEDNAIKRFTLDRRVETVIKDPRLSWPDSFAIGTNDTIYVTISQIHLGEARTEPYRLFKLN